MQQVAPWIQKALFKDPFEANNSLFHLVEAILKVFPDYYELYVFTGANVGFDFFGCRDIGHIIYLYIFLMLPIFCFNCVLLLGRIELPYRDLEAPTLPLSYRSLMYVLFYVFAAAIV